MSWHNDLNKLLFYASINFRNVFASDFFYQNRIKWFTNAALRTELHSYLGGISKQLDCPPIIVGGVEDHVHMLARMGRGITQSDWVKELKRMSSVWVKQQAQDMEEFSWQAGYGIFSVSASALETVEQYIRNQEEHHKKMTVQEEYRVLLQKHGVAWDEKYVWE